MSMFGKVILFLSVDRVLILDVSMFAESDIVHDKCAFVKEWFLIANTVYHSTFSFFYYVAHYLQKDITCLK